jgi:uncharacterized protein (TIGR02271 family)
MAEEQEVAAIPLVEERVQISKRQVETGRLRVRVTVGEREEAVPVSLDHDEVEVRRVPRGIPLASIPSVRIEGNVTVIPVVEEVAVVEKRLMLIEEIHVRRKTVTATEHVPVRLRAEQAEVEREGEALDEAAS